MKNSLKFYVVNLRNYGKISKQKKHRANTESGK